MKPRIVLKYIALLEMCNTKQDLSVWECAFGGKVDETKDKIVRLQMIKDYLMERIKRNERN